MLNFLNPSILVLDARPGRAFIGPLDPMMRVIEAQGPDYSTEDLLVVFRDLGIEESPLRLGPLAYASKVVRQMCRLDGKVAIVTGGAGPGIGHGISSVLARRGAFVAILEIDLERAELVRRDIEKAGGRAAIYRCDISQASDVESVVEQIVDEEGKLDVLVNSAGIGLVSKVTEVSEKEFDRLVDIDLRGLWLCCKAVIPHMQRRRCGSIINIASVHGRATMPLFGVYAGIKAGVAGLTRGIAVQYGPDNIRANAVCPGLVHSRQNRQIVAKLTSDVDGWLKDYVRRHQAIPQLIQPQDVGNLVAFLAGDESAFITGAEIPIDAGTWAQLISRD